MNASNLAGKDLNDYRVLRRLGQGAMAEVFLAEQKSLGRQVALKVLNRDLAADTTYVQRFQQEARSAAALIHAHIVQIYDVGEECGDHFIAQEYVPGQNLGEFIRRTGRVEPGLALSIMRQVAAALHKAAEMGIVHRDIKPENIMLAPSGDVKVADFGLARAQQDTERTKLTQVGVTMGTPLYMSPEQIEGRPVDSRSDIYSLGVTAYHMLAGEPPFSADTPLAVAVQHLKKTPQPLAERASDAPSQLCNVVHRMLAKRADARFASPAELLDELQVLSAEAALDGWRFDASDVAVDFSQSRLGAGEGRLAKLMKTSSQRKLPRLAPWKIVGLLMICLVLGIAAGWFWRPPSLLAGVPSGPPQRDSVWAQIFHARIVDTEDAWLAVHRYFPREDPYYHRLAKQGLVRHYLYTSQEFERAIPLLNDLRTSSDNGSSLHSFAIAGLIVGHTKLNRPTTASQFRAQLTAEQRTQVQESDPRLFAMLEEIVAPSSSAPQQPSAQSKN